jgi:cation diffusion facilitator CzcD-associated flavoprotein CzcO
MESLDQFDLLIIGGGIGGVIALHYAKKAGLKTVLLERQDRVGGLWAQLPAWQDIQNNANDWTLGDLPIAGTDQASIVSNIQAWVDKFDLSPFILLNTPASQVKETETGWAVSTPATTYFAKNLIAATGSHNRPYLPPVERVNVSLQEHHSSGLLDPRALTGKDVVVVGGGASAYDLLELCLEHEAKRIIWIYRSHKWMTPTRKPKYLASDLRGLARQQMLGASAQTLSQAVNLDLRARYDKFGLNDILPAGDFDFTSDQIIPGRHRMIENFQQLTRYRAKVRRISACTLELSTGQRLDADLVLWGTGYSLDLSYFDMPQLSGLTQSSALAKRCGDLYRSLDADSLFFLAPNTLESTGATPWAYSHAARTIVAHIQGAAHLGLQPTHQKINHFDAIKFLAARDTSNFQSETWFSCYKNLAFEHPENQPLPIP